MVVSWGLFMLPYLLNSWWVHRPICGRHRPVCSYRLTAYLNDPFKKTSFSISWGKLFVLFRYLLNLLPVSQLSVVKYIQNISFFFYCPYLGFFICRSSKGTIWYCSYFDQTKNYPLSKGMVIYLMKSSTEPILGRLIVILLKPGTLLSTASHNHQCTE